MLGKKIKEIEEQKIKEAAEQKAIVDRCKREKILIASTENSLNFPNNVLVNFLRPMLYGQQLILFSKRLSRLLNELTEKRKALGMLLGFPDLFIPDYMLFLEMKRRDGGVISKDQERAHKQLRNAGYITYVAFGGEKAWLKIKEVRQIKMNYDRYLKENNIMSFLEFYKEEQDDNIQSN